MLEIAEAGAAVFLLDRDPEQAHLPEFRPQVARERVGAVDFIGARRDAITGETLDRVAQGIDVGAEPEIERAPGIGDHGGEPPRGE